MYRRGEPWGRTLVGGVTAGVLGAIVLGAFVFVRNAVYGLDVWVGMKAPAAVFLGSRALVAGRDATAIGAGLACLVAGYTLAAVAAAFVAHGEPRRRVLVAGAPAGLALGMLAWLLTRPAHGFAEAWPLPAWVWGYAHALWGTVVAIALLPFQRAR